MPIASGPDFGSIRPFDLGGSSFGGMVALEMARILEPENVFLFGSCRSPEGLAPSARALGWMAPLCPDRLLLLPALLRRPVAWWFGAASAADTELFAGMLESTPIEFLRWASRAVMSWDGVRELPVPVHHVHGERDRLIPARRRSRHPGSRSSAQHHARGGGERLPHRGRLTCPAPGAPRKSSSSPEGQLLRPVQLRPDAHHLSGHGPVEQRSPTVEQMQPE